MIEKVSFHPYHKKIIPYLDGSLSQDEISEFEAFVMTHPEFDKLIQDKKEEIQLIKNFIPCAQLSQESRESLQSEFKASINNLLKEKSEGFWDKIRSRFQELN